MFPPAKETNNFGLGASAESRVPNVKKEGNKNCTNSWYIKFPKLPVLKGDPQNDQIGKGTP